MHMPDTIITSEKYLFMLRNSHTFLIVSTQNYRLSVITKWSRRLPQLTSLIMYVLQFKICNEKYHKQHTEELKGKACNN